MKIAFVTLGCKLNFAETATYERGFRAAGLEIVPWREKADIYLVNTCTVTETANKKSRCEIRKLHRINPDAHIIVTGCYAQMKADEVRAIEGVSRVFLAGEKDRVVPETLEAIVASTGLVGTPFASLTPAPPNVSCVVSDHLSPSGPVPLPLSGGGQVLQGRSDYKGKEGQTFFPAYSTLERTRAFLKVQDGCDNFCRYCTVPYARGRSRSIPFCEAVKAAEAIASKGIREVVITGVNTGDFGRDTGESFLDLLKALNAVDGIERWRISSIEPNLITEEIIDWIASGTKFQPHFHIPLQQGTDEILSRMGRKYTTGFFAGRIDYIRRRLEGPGKPKVFFGIDVMAGLPGETEDLFEAELQFLRRIRPAFIHVFPYSRRPGTPAASMPDQVDEKVKAERVKVLEALCNELHEQFIRDNKGIKEQVLFESRDRDGSMSGYTGNYIRISRPYDRNLVGKLTEVTI